MYRYALAAITVFAAASVDSRPVQEDIEVELEASTPPIASSTSPTNESAQSNDTQKGSQKSPGEPELIGFPGMTDNVAPWSSNGGYGTGAPNGPPTPMEPGPNGWQGPTGGHNGGPDSMGGYGCRSCGGHGHGYSSSGGYNGWPGYMGGYGCRSCGGHGHGYSSSGGYNGWPGYMGGFDGWKGPDMGGYGCRGCGNHGYGYVHNHQHHHHEYHGQGGGRRCEHCGHGGPGGWGTFGGNGEKGGYGAPYGHDNRGHSYGYGRGGQGYSSGF
ncbi:hypothetical protein GCK32_022351 [Trichostrongylus colubriformis]|uniref:Uncharacterized protein n=1 Tax=Trichostrongylus colubriformis TaxID=6319 RepID=A0AAN8FM14_TRICO